MIRWLSILALAASLWGAEVYRVDGRVTPEGPLFIFLHSVSTPLTRKTRAFPGGRFTFKRIPAGNYTLAIYIRGRGMALRTIDVGPAVADKKRRVALALKLDPSEFVPATPRQAGYLTSVTDLSIPVKARREYLEAQKDLARPDADSAIKHLERAVALAPRFAAGWNNLGTIAYQQRKFRRAAECFRKALEADPETFDALVNLGGALLALNEIDEAIGCNVQAVARRPKDALAQSQLGVSYFAVGNFELAVKHLELARQIDPGHFSSPQLALAEIHLRRGEKRQAADVLEEYLRYHPDYPQAAKVREEIGKLRR
ncbi:MAG: tetratricopeptide repeat protein [Acidobacteriia bacterium]|nr:tetratricopeptide repeat protein [Terriglobia bacterium]